MKLCFFVLALLAIVINANGLSVKVPIINYYNNCIIWGNQIFTQFPHIQVFALLTPDIILFKYLALNIHNVLFINM